MISLGTILAAKFPHANPLRDYRVEDHNDGKGQVVGLWNEKALGPKPTEQQIETFRAEFSGVPAIGRWRGQVLSQRADCRDLMKVIETATPEEIVAYVDKEAANLPALRVLMTKILLVLAAGGVSQPSS